MQYKIKLLLTLFYIIEAWSTPYFQQILDPLTYELGWEYLNFILEKDPSTAFLFDKFQENDATGLSPTFDYGTYGWFSPATLRYIKIACDLKYRFDDLGKMHIVEIGGGDGGQCKILAELTGFASYTIIERPEVLELTKKHLSSFNIPNIHFVENQQLSQIASYDLVISNYVFSETNRLEQEKYLQHVINPSKNGYMTIKSSSHSTHSISIDELIRIMYENKRKGSIHKEYPSTNPDHLTMTWKTNPQPKPSSKPLDGDLEDRNGITYSLSGGRLGDNLYAYFHAKWLAFKYNLPLYNVQFPYADQFFLSDEDPFLKSFDDFQNIITTTNEDDLKLDTNSSLFLIPYFPESTEYNYDRNKNYPIWHPPFEVDWEDPEFHSKLVRSLTPKNSGLIAKIPKNQLSVGVHIRRGGGVDPLEERLRVPLRFPSDDYYIQQIKRVARIFKDQPLHVYIVTDDLTPSLIAKRYKNTIDNPNIYFDCRSEKNGPSHNILEDFFLISQLDCLILPQSHFSLMASKIEDHSILITPIHANFVNNSFEIDEIELNFNGQKQYN